MKTIKDLNKGETLLTTITKVAGDKYQVEIAEFVSNPEARANLAALLNEDDARFKSATPKARRAWQSGTQASILKYLGIDVTKLAFAKVKVKRAGGEKEVEQVEMNILNPKILGQRVHIELRDSFEPAREGQSPKLSIGADEVTRYFMKDGKNIYQNTSVVVGEAKHKIILSDELVAEFTPVTADASQEA